MAGPTAVGERFIEAIAWGEHTVVWELLSEAGRSVALSVALTNGLDRVVASRISDDLADPVERDEFLRQLVHGLRRDLRSVDIARIQVGDVADVADGHGTTTVALTTPSALPMGEAWAAGQIILSPDVDGRWRVDRVEPIIAGP